MRAVDKLEWHITQRESLTQEHMFSLALNFRDIALRENNNKRTGVMRRFVYLSTGNSKKLKEFIRTFDRYGIEVIQIPELPPNAKKFRHVKLYEKASSNRVNWLISALLTHRTKDLVPIAVLREETCLYKAGTKIFSSRRPGCYADHHSLLKSWSAKPTIKSTDINVVSNSQLSSSNLLKMISINATKSIDMEYDEYSHTTAGTIITLNHNNSSENNMDVYGWDNQFQILATGCTYQEHLRKGLKISSRDMVISAFLKDKVYYKDLKSLAYKTLSLSRPIDFSCDVATHIQEISYYHTPTAVRYGFENMLNHVANEGIFFKAADTRVEANYWQPG
jgi:hypothetical protein